PITQNSESFFERLSDPADNRPVRINQRCSQVRPGFFNPITITRKQCPDKLKRLSERIKNLRLDPLSNNLQAQGHFIELLTNPSAVIREKITQSTHLLSQKAHHIRPNIGGFLLQRISHRPPGRSDVRTPVSEPRT